jgi:hypothetical protein
MAPPFTSHTAFFWLSTAMPADGKKETNAFFLNLSYGYVCPKPVLAKHLDVVSDIRQSHRRTKQRAFSFSFSGVFFRTERAQSLQHSLSKLNVILADTTSEHNGVAISWELCTKRLSPFPMFPYVCPEPVLAIVRVLV